MDGAGNIASDAIMALGRAFASPSKWLKLAEVGIVRCLPGECLMRTAPVIFLPLETVLHKNGDYRASAAKNAPDYP